MSQPLKYSVSYTNPSSQIVTFQLKIEEISTHRLTLKLPLWRPGRYERQNFAKNIYKIEAKDESNHLLNTKKTDTNTWEVELTNNTKSVIVTYDYYASQMDAGGIWLDEEQLYINWITCALQVMEVENAPYEVHLNTPKNYEVATSLKKDGHTLYAKSFFELVDSPLIASAELEYKTYSIDGTTFYIWFKTDVALPWDKIINDFILFSKTQIEFFGSFPTNEYHFLFQLLPYPHYHGVEHRDSTVITLGPSEKINEEELYDHLLGISSHELFHTWNVTRLQPKEFIPYQLHEETYFDIGFILEGITTLYGDYMLYKAGVWSKEKYIKELNILLKRHFNNYGRFNLSIVESSLDLWVDGYKLGTPNRKVSIYVKGAIITLLLHLKIKSLTQNTLSFDEVIKTLWDQFGKGGIGYELKDFIKVVNELTKNNLTEFIEKLVYGNDSIENSLDELLPHFNSHLRKVESEQVCERKWGFKTKFNSQIALVDNIAPNSPAFEVLSIGDEIIAVNKKKVTKENLSILLDNQEVELAFFRENRLFTRLVKMKQNQTYYFTFEIVENSDADLFNEFS